VLIPFITHAQLDNILLGDSNSINKNINYPVSVLIPGTRHAAPWDTNIDDSVPIAIPKSLQTATKTSNNWNVKYGRVVVTTADELVTCCSTDDEKTLVTTFLNNLIKSRRESTKSSSSLTGELFNGVIFTRAGIHKLCSYDDRGVKRRKLLGGTKRKFDNNDDDDDDKDTGSDDPIPKLLQLGLLIECPPPARTAFIYSNNNDSSSGNGSITQIGIELHSPNEPFGFILSLPGLLPSTHETLLTYRAGLISLLRKNNTKSSGRGSSVSTSGLGVPVGGANGVEAWMEKFVRTQEERRLKSNRLIGSKLEPAREVSVGFLVRRRASEASEPFEHPQGQPLGLS